MRRKICQIEAEARASLVPKCPACGVRAVEEHLHIDEFPYGDPPHVTLSALVILGVCQDCGFSFTDWRAEGARDAAVAMWKEQHP